MTTVLVDYNHIYVLNMFIMPPLLDSLNQTLFWLDVREHHILKGYTINLIYDLNKTLGDLRFTEQPENLSTKVLYEAYIS